MIHQFLPFPTLVSLTHPLTNPHPPPPTPYTPPHPPFKLPPPPLPHYPLPFLHPPSTPFFMKRLGTPFSLTGSIFPPPSFGFSTIPPITGLSHLVVPPYITIHPLIFPPPNPLKLDAHESLHCLSATLSSSPPNATRLPAHTNNLPPVLFTNAIPTPLPPFLPHDLPTR